jgi:hypothetical protein
MCAGTWTQDHGVDICLISQSTWPSGLFYLSARAVSMGPVTCLCNRAVELSGALWPSAGVLPEGLHNRVGFLPSSLCVWASIHLLLTYFLFSFFFSQYWAFFFPFFFQNRVLRTICQADFEPQSSCSVPPE